MALLSPKHFSAPFRNRTHLISMGAIIFLFAAFRIAGGGTGYVENSQAPESQTPDEVLQELDRDASQNQEDKIGKPSLQARPDDSGDVNRSITDDILRGVDKEDEELRERRAREANTRSKDDLEDIERAMGLR